MVGTVAWLPVEGVLVLVLVLELMRGVWVVVVSGAVLVARVWSRGSGAELGRAPTWRV